MRALAPVVGMVVAAMAVAGSKVGTKALSPELAGSAQNDVGNL